jgi:hypothetical protein
MYLGPCPRNKYQLKLFKFYLSSLIPRQGFSKPTLPKGAGYFCARRILIRYAFHSLSSASFPSFTASDWPPGPSQAMRCSPSRPESPHCYSRALFWRFLYTLAHSASPPSFLRSLGSNIEWCKWKYNFTFSYYYGSQVPYLSEPLASTIYLATISLTLNIINITAVHLYVAKIISSLIQNTLSVAYLL